MLLTWSVGSFNRPLYGHLKANVMWGIRPVICPNVSTDSQMMSLSVLLEHRVNGIGVTFSLPLYLGKYTT
ncbi:hypothetical protein XELAEV_18002684mg [Xenopus laevis]|nr:hypothetical protein XELAEV_18002684mg [Xenopus laevis]